MKKPKLKRILKRTLAIIVAVPLTLIILFTAVPFAGSIGWNADPLPPDATTTLRRASIGERWTYGAGRLLDGLTRMPKNLPDAVTYQSEHFYPGGDGAGEAWHLGYAQAIITPEDWESKAYYVGGDINIPARKFADKIDDLKVRVIALSTGDGNVNIFAAVDSIGVTNWQARQIRALVADMDLESVNIAATHTHTAPDSLGVFSKGGKADQDYNAFVNEKTAGAIRAAVAAMEPGRLYISQIGQKTLRDYWDRFWEKMDFNWETDEWNAEWSAKYDRIRAEMATETTAEDFGLGYYLANKRAGGDLPTQLNKLRFAPLDEASQETLLLNFAAHPYTAGLKLPEWPANSISGDFPYYMEELINEAGANMIYFNGAVNGIYPNRGNTRNSPEDDPESWEGHDHWHDWQTLAWQARRIGRDYAGLALAMTMEPEEIALHPQTDPSNDHSFLYRDIVTMMQNNGTVSETELSPRLDIRLRELQLEIENPLVRFAAKRGMLNYTLLRGDRRQLMALTEVGWLELGGEATIALMPGEITPGMAWGGGDTLAERAIRMRDFGPTLSEIAGRDVLVFGLCNDELGYVIPDNDYIMFHFPLRNLTPKLLDIWSQNDYYHYAELLSPGPGTAGVFARAFEELAE